jgi:molecular chaperone DnaK
MKQEAEAHAEEDRQRREEVELRNQADSLAYAAEKAMRDAGDKVPADVRTEIEEGVRAVREALASQDLDQVRTAMGSLQESMQKAGSAVYGEAGAEGPPPAGEAPPEGEPPPEGEGEGTVEGEYREV